jgi:hypothetical protein
MNSRNRGVLQLLALVAVFLLLFRFFPRAFAFAELAARELRYLWWLVLLVALAIWLIWGVNRRPK